MAKITVDVTMLTGYSTASLGTHQLTIISEADGYINSDPSSPVTFINGYAISFNLTHCTRTPVATAIDRFSDTTFTITADANYKLPEAITVTNNISYTWNNTTGVLVIKKPEKEVSVTIVATQDVFAITKSATNGTWSGASTINAGGLETLTLTPNTNYKLPTSVNVTGAIQSWNASTGKLTLSNPTADVHVSATCPIITYSITETLTNVTKSGTHPTTINAGSTVTLKYTADANYELPNSVTVTGATSTWTKSTGTLTISNPTANVTVRVIGVNITYALTETLTNVSKSGTHPTTIGAGKSVELNYTADTNYNLPDSVSVDNATSSWQKSTGRLLVSNPTGDVTITITAVRITYSITENLTNVTKSGTHPSVIAAGQTLVLNYAATTGYNLPDTVTVTGATSDWKPATGVLTITNATGAVTITIVAVQPKLAAPTNLSVSDDTLSFDSVENAEQYEVFAGSNSIGMYTAVVRHTLTFNNNDGQLSVEVNNQTVTSPYILKNGDKITAHNSGDFTLEINGTVYSDDTTLNLSNTDITIRSTGTALFVGPTVTINYSE
mgnify:CR=1 FL=1|uniref:Uncharacterized protein n=1 Tax=Myoviridae sp. ctbEa13 TaxID=2825136 RepID=A0A8S5VBM2_9CAUD|nr:MAG TPA: hypothetical protein [Myoviridae sp. ctbEa13]